jgi:hypothetical protein
MVKQGAPKGNRNAAKDYIAKLQANAPMITGRIKAGAEKAVSGAKYAGAFAVVKGYEAAGYRFGKLPGDSQMFMYKDKNIIQKAADKSKAIAGAGMVTAGKKLQDWSGVTAERKALSAQKSALSAVRARDEANNAKASAFASRDKAVAARDRARVSSAVSKTKPKINVELPKNYNEFKPLNPINVTAKPMREKTKTDYNLAQSIDRLEARRKGPAAEQSYNFNKSIETLEARRALDGKTGGPPTRAKQSERKRLDRNVKRSVKQLEKTAKIDRFLEEERNLPKGGNKDTGALTQKAFKYAQQTKFPNHKSSGPQNPRNSELPGKAQERWLNRIEIGRNLSQYPGTSKGPSNPRQSSLNTVNKTIAKAEKEEARIRADYQKKYGKPLR